MLVAKLLICSGVSRFINQNYIESCISERIFKPERHTISLIDTYEALFFDHHISTECAELNLYAPEEPGINESLISGIVRSL